MPRIRTHSNGSPAFVSCSAVEVAEWHSGLGINQSGGVWPAATLRSSFVASFDSRGNLTDLHGPRASRIDPDSRELCAIVADACQYRRYPVPTSCLAMVAATAPRTTGPNATVVATITPPTSTATAATTLTAGRRPPASLDLRASTMTPAEIDHLVSLASAAERAYLRALRRRFGAVRAVEARYSILGVSTPELRRLFDAWRDALLPLRTSTWKASTCPTA